MKNPTSFNPDFYSFSAKADAGLPQLLWLRVSADLETPVSAYLKLVGWNGRGFLLESVLGGEVRGRYSIIGTMPDLEWSFNGQSANLKMLDEAGKQCGEITNYADVLGSLRKLLADSMVEIPPELPPMASGIVGYLGYETIGLVEKIPSTKADLLGIPDGLLMRPRVMAIFDAIAGDIFLVTVVRPHQGITAEQLYYDGRKLLEAAELRLNSPIPPAPEHDGGAVEFTPNMSRADYYSMIERAKEYIRAGDIFQTVLSQRFSSSFDYPSFAFYRSLRHLNPSPFLFFLNFGGFQLVGSSPEILVRVRDNKVTVRPIAGTRKRGANSEEDNMLAEDLRQDPKELAEHLMLLDLGRNDVGRVAAAGSVTVTEKMLIERYSHVMHLVSNVEGRLADGFDAVDALLAGFPAGTVSGAPKIRAMEIIDELEPTKRKFYAGGVGYFSGNGSMDSCIALRTALIKDGRIHAQSGGGVVADSTPDGEYQESCNKARALIKAAEDSGNFC